MSGEELMQCLYFKVFASYCCSKPYNAYTCTLVIVVFSQCFQVLDC